MRVCVFVKQVPAVEHVKVDPVKGTLIRDGCECRINPYDLHAVELGLRLKDELRAEVIVATMGPPQAKSVLTDSIAMGADSAYLISDRAFAGSDAWATSVVLSSFIRFLKDVDVIVCGNYSVDGETGMVGPEMAQLLEIPSFTYVTELIAADNDGLTVRRNFEAADIIFKSSYPVLLTVGKEVNEPRIPSFGGMLKAKNAEVTVLDAAALGIDPAAVGIDGSPTKVARIFENQRDLGGTVFSGSTEEQVDQLLVILEGQGHLKCL